MRLNDPAIARRAINLTPLIDVVFLLLVFFMLASTFLKFTALPISGASLAAAPSDVRKIAFLHVTDGNRLRLNGEALSPDQVVTQLNELADQGLTQLIVVPAATANVQDIVGVLAAARKSRFKTITVTH